MAKTYKANKFNAKKTEKDGIMFDSKKEALFYSNLQMLMKAEKTEQRVVEIQLQPRYNMIINDIMCGFYKADFKVTYANGKIKVFDVKGYKGGAAYQIFALKKKIVQAIYNIEIIEV